MTHFALQRVPWSVALPLSNGNFCLKIRARNEVRNEARFETRNGVRFGGRNEVRIGGRGGTRYAVRSRRADTVNISPKPLRVESV